MLKEWFTSELRTFFTPRIVGMLHMVAQIVHSGSFALFMAMKVVSQESSDTRHDQVVRLAVLCVMPAVWVTGSVMMRITAEVVLVTFRIEEHLRALREGRR